LHAERKLVETDDDRDHGTHRRTCRYADGCRLGEGIAEDSLHDHAGDGQARTHDEREHHARQTNLPEHVVRDDVRVAPARAVADDAQEFAERNAERPRSERHQHRYQQQHGEKHSDCGEAGSACFGHASLL